MKYCFLTGSKNNAGDFLIKHRAFKLIKKYRPEIEIIDVNGWEANKFADKLKACETIVLCGGPSLQPKMWEKIYNFDLNILLNKRLVALGIGSKTTSIMKSEENAYRFSESSAKLIQNLVCASVRDMQTKRILSKFVPNEHIYVTGCPATFEEEKMQLGEKVIFSVGVTFSKNKYISQKQKEIINVLIDQFGKKNLIVAFHHGIGASYLDSNNADLNLHKHNRLLVQYLEQHQIAYEDISGDVDKLLSLYGRAKFHVGYRLHAHINMLANDKPTLLIAEDGRGLAFGELYDGVNMIPAFEKQFARTIFQKIKMKYFSYDDRLQNNINKEAINQSQHSMQSLIDNRRALEETMHHFITSIL